MGRYKRTVYWIIPIAILALFFYFFGPKKPVTDNEYVQYIQAAPVVENSKLTTEEAFKSYCEKGKWEYFQTKMMEHVVEFKGECSVNEQVLPVNLQYVVEKGQTEYRVGAMLVNGEKQSDQQRNDFLTTMQQ